MPRIISGGNGEVELAALRAASSAGLKTAGWLATDESIPDAFGLIEYPLGGTRKASHANIRDTDATLFIHGDNDHESIRRASARSLSRSLGKSFLCIHVDDDPSALVDWIDHFDAVNITGSEDPVIGKAAFEILSVAFARLGG